MWQRLQVVKRRHGQHTVEVKRAAKIFVPALIAVFVSVALGVVVSSRVTEWDRLVASQVAQQRSPAVSAAFALATTIGDPDVMPALTVLAALGFTTWGRWRAGLLFAASMLGGQAVVWLVKLLVERLRPPPAAALIPTPESFSFPSGHAFSGLVFFTLGSLLVSAGWPSMHRGVFVLASTVLGTTVGASRVYLGVHWPSDVIASWILALAWVTFAWSVHVTIRESEGPSPSALSRPLRTLASAVLAAAAVFTVLLGLLT